MRRVQGLYIMSVAAQLLEMHPQTLRKYERAGFVEPPRMGMLRLYSEEDIARLRLIKHFVEELGLNLAGVEMALGLVARLLDLRAKAASAASEGAGIVEVVDSIDEALLELGVRVTREDASRTQPARRALPGDTGHGQAVEDLTRLARGRARQQGRHSR